MAPEDKQSFSHPAPRSFCLLGLAQALHGDARWEGRGLTAHSLASVWTAPLFPPSLLGLFLLLALHCGQFLWRCPPTPHCGRLVILTIPLNPPSGSWRKVLVICISILQMKKVEAQRDDLICPKSRHWQWTSGLSESKGQASPLILPTCSCWVLSPTARLDLSWGVRLCPMSPPSRDSFPLVPFASHSVGQSCLAQLWQAAGSQFNSFTLSHP